MPMLPGLTGVLLAAIGIGMDTALITPLAFATLAADTPDERIGPAAELGRELATRADR